MEYIKLPVPEGYTEKGLFEGLADANFWNPKIKTDVIKTKEFKTAAEADTFAKEATGFIRANKVSEVLFTVDILEKTEIDNSETKVDYGKRLLFEYNLELLKQASIVNGMKEHKQLGDKIQAEILKKVSDATNKIKMP